ncbi:MAG: hypothetical protein O3B01_20310 [Planctomycetota bacterium]|nr:hypothetical protein [Planctomycetota bacterium]
MSVITALARPLSAQPYSGRPAQNSGSFVNYSLPRDSTSVTTLAAGEEGGQYPPQITTLAVGEEGGSSCPPSRPVITTQAVGEEGGYCPPPENQPQQRPYEPDAGPNRPPVSVPGSPGRPNYDVPPGGIFRRPYQPPHFESYESRVFHHAPGTVVLQERHQKWGHSGYPPPPPSGRTGLGIFA